jgi:3-vinyl bacteriochlorophyllide hydratase
MPARSESSTRRLYSSEQRQRRDASPWTVVQGVLAPLQFVAFLVSAGLVLRFLVTGQDGAAAALSVVGKTGVLYLIMITGAVWEKAVFGRYLFAPAFFWEDVVSLGVLALHTAYLAAWLGGWGTPEARFALALAAYAAYLLNAAQFVLKLRTARLQAPVPAAWTVAEPARGASSPPPAANGPSGAIGASARCSAALPASCGCTARSRTPFSWWWGRAPALTSCSRPQAS